ncbi:hypothetical protein CI105_05780 [Candidatus Izimaplasma bacterium ZiA1]|uniref:FAD binding domain-containing protein n=1 Tax=Candidatus Izimoplasma sp. ZiA1 TaxID=2024899 RepID=UPI000BAA6802|nr:hypothetical protein CI105_05780 [Candidatus Izimaplasma bacterium ZiA1]
MVKHIIPNSLSEALDYMSKDEYKIVSGGTDLMVQKRAWAETPPKFDQNTIYIFNLMDLKYIKKENNKIIIGANYPVEKIKDFKSTPILLKKAIEIMASPALRNLATIAGNIGNASPAGDTLPILYVHDALVKIVSKNNSRIVPINEVILSVRKTCINKDEMIKEIIIPILEFTKTSFVKVGGRKADAISKTSFTGAVNVKDGIVKDIRIAFGAVNVTVVRKKEIENKYKGLSVLELQSRINEILNDYEPFIKPITDQRSNKDYRKQVSLNLLKEFINNL